MSADFNQKWSGSGGHVNGFVAIQKFDSQLCSFRPGKDDEKFYFLTTKIELCIFTAHKNKRSSNNYHAVAIVLTVSELLRLTLR